MAVDATHLNPFPPQLIQNRGFFNPLSQGNAGCAYSSSPHNMQFFANSFGIALPENQPSYPPSVCVGVQAKTSVKTGSELTCNVVPVPRKRSRDQLYATPNFTALQKHDSVSQLSSFAGEDILPQIQQHQLEIDTIISQHMKKIRLEIEERQKQQAKLLAAAIGEGVVKVLRQKDDQIQRMGKLNYVLQERVKSLYVENQLLRDLAQTNEATANSLRTNLEQVLLQVAGEDHVSARGDGGTAAEEEVASCCGSIEDAEGGRAQDLAESRGGNGDRRCRKCGDRESSVLLLPCRHLCLCGGCGSGSQQVQACPVCHSSTNATLHVNMSS